MIVSANRCRRTIIAFACLLLSAAASAEGFTGRVVRIIDGDSIVVLNDEQQTGVCLEGIDYPESGQAFGSRAKRLTSELAFGKTVTVKATGKDRYGRTLARLVLPDETELYSEFVPRGFAWWFRRYSDEEALLNLEAEAHKAKRGLWSDPKAIAPWSWRVAQRAKTDVPPAEIEVLSKGILITMLLPNPRGVDADNEQVTIGNSTTEPVDLAGWRLIDKAGNVFLLSGTVKPGGPLVVTMTEVTKPLNNYGDTVLLVDPEGVARNSVCYDEGQRRAEVVVDFGKCGKLLRQFLSLAIY